MQVRQNTFKRRESSLSLNGFTSVNFNDEEDFNNWSSLSDYYSNWIQTGNYLNTLSTDDGIYKNTFLQFNFIPLEIDYQIVKDKFGVYSNFSLQPVVSVYSDWNGIIENNEENDVFNDLQMGVEVGFQYHIFKSVAVQGSYFRGITDVYKNIKYHAKWNSIRLGIVYNLN